MFLGPGESGITSGTGQPANLLVDNAPVTSGQMLKSQFLDQLRAQVTAAANQELGPIYSAIGCPYIDQYFGRYAGQPASAGEALIKRFAPATRGAHTAAEMIPLVVAKVREGVRTWRDTGQPPPDIAAAEPAAAAASDVPQAQALRAPDGRETTASLEAELGSGASLDLVDGVIGNEIETNDNDFAKWVRGLGPEPTDTSKMNCWEMVLFAGYKAGVIPKAWIVSVHDDAAKAGAAASSTGAYQGVLAGRLNVGAAANWTPGTAVPRGNLVFFDGLKHVALATGNVVGGKQEVMSLWVFPSTGGGLLNSAAQRTTIEDLQANGVVSVANIKYGPNPW